MVSASSRRTWTRFKRFRQAYLDQSASLAESYRINTRLDHRLGRHTTHCRGGPPWPPLRRIRNEGRPRRAAPTVHPRLMMMGRTIIFIIAAACVVAMGVPARPVQKPKYNVIIIASDDLRPSLGCYGDKLVKTPNIDKLAARGVRFDRAYTQFPLCNPSRSSLLTGRYPTQTGVMDNELYFRALHPEFVSLPQHFKANDYSTLRAGKIFHGGIDDTDAWTEGGEARRFTGAQRPPSNADSTERIAHSDRIVVLDGEGENSEDYRTASRAIELLERYKDQPFFLAVGSAKPHSPPSAPKKFFDLYDVNKIPLPPDFSVRPVAPPGFPEISIARRNTDLFIGRDATPDTAREMI